MTDRPAPARWVFVIPISLALVLTAAHLGAPPASNVAATAPRLVLALLVIVAASRGLGVLFRALCQPRVVGEMAAGILLGPVLLGRALPAASAALFPPAVRPALSVVAQLSVLLYMFLVGTEFDVGRLRQRSRASVAISHASIALPFALGAALAVAVRPLVGATGVSAWVFALFLGVAMSVTAFPVLARIVDECDLRDTPLGALTMACAAVDDATAWCVLAAVVGLARPGGPGLLAVAPRLVLYLLAAYFLMRPAARAQAVAWERRGRASVLVLPATLTLLAASAWATEAAGVHPIFGVFVAGLVIPHDSALTRGLHTGLHDGVVALLPAFFAAAGLKMRTDALGAALGLLLPAVVVVASVGKVGGSAVAARLSGLGWRDALTLGVLMNTRGLMELVVLQVGLDLGILSVDLFSVMVLMALATTLMTTPIVRGLLRNGSPLTRVSPDVAPGGVRQAAQRRPTRP